MKKIIALLSALTMITALAGCSNESRTSSEIIESTTLTTKKTTTTAVTEPKLNFEEEVQNIIDNDEYTEYDIGYLKIDLPWIERVETLETSAVDGLQEIWCDQRNLSQSDDVNSVFITVEPDYITDLGSFNDYMEEDNLIYESKEFESDKLGKVSFYRYQSYKKESIDSPPIAYYDTYLYAFYDRDRNLITFEIQFPENWSCDYSKMAEYIFQSIELPEGHYPENDFLSVEDNYNTYKECINKGKYADLYDLLQQHLESENVKENDSAYKAVESLDKIMPYIDSVDIEYDEISEEGTIKFKSIKDISSVIHVVPIAYTHSSNVSIKVGFEKADWLFFDRVTITGKEDNWSRTMKSYDKEQDVISGGTIRESIVENINLEDLLNISQNEAPIIRFENQKDDKKIDYQLSKDEINAIKIIYEFGVAYRKLSDLSWDYKKYMG